MATQITSTLSKCLHIVAIQSVTPGRMTEPGQTRQISVVDYPMNAQLLQSRFQIVLYYKKGSEEESPVNIAAWIKESLGVALVEQPLLAGRLRRDKESEGYWEVKLNDGGVRLVQATTDMSLEEYMGSKEVRVAREGQLAYWMDIDIDNPHFSALFYIQVTQFKGDEYSIGISCSFLLSDPLFLTRFLKLWAQIHNQMLIQGRLSKSPMFHLGYFQRPGRPSYLSSMELESNRIIHSTSTTFFKIKGTSTSSALSYSALGSACLDEVTKETNKNDKPKFYLVINDHSNHLQIEPCSKSGLAQINSSIDVASWYDFGMEEMALVEGNKPTFVSFNVVSNIEGFVVVMVSSDEKIGKELMISVTIPKI